MKLTIKTNYPDWWKHREPVEKEFWLDKLEWLDYQPRRTFGDNCFDSWTVIDETLCYMDIGTHTISKLTKTEWLYKFINHNIDQAQLGIINEYQNILEMLQCFPCG